MTTAEQLMAHIVVEQGRWESLPDEVRLQLIRNHLWALRRRKVVMLTQEELSELAERYAGSMGKYPWEFIYYRYKGQMGGVAGLCGWRCSQDRADSTLAGIDDFFASPSLERGGRHKAGFLARLCEWMAGKGEGIELGKVHNIFEGRSLRQVTTSDGIQRVIQALRQRIEAARKKGEHLAIVMFTGANFYDPLGKGEDYLVDPGLAVGNDVIQGLVKEGFPLRAVLVETSADGIEQLACCGAELREMIDGIWKAERRVYEGYGARAVELVEHETVDGGLISMKWPYDYVSRTWEEYGRWLSEQREPLKLLRRALSLMRRAQLMPLPFRLSVFVF